MLFTLVRRTLENSNWKKCVALVELREDKRRTWMDIEKEKWRVNIGRHTSVVAEQLESQWLPVYPVKVENR